MTDEEVVKNMSDFEMMRRPHLWPHMFLPLKNPSKRTQDHPFAQEGILFSQGKDEGFMFLANQNMFMPIPKGANFEYGGEEMLQRLVKEGWLVD